MLGLGWLGPRSYLHVLHGWNDSPMPPSPALLVEMGISRTFSLGWLWAKILPISTSQTARITGVSHYSWLNGSIKSNQTLKLIFLLLLTGLKVATTTYWRVENYLKMLITDTQVNWRNSGMS
jgi:hypothetical protein